MKSLTKYIKHRAFTRSGPPGYEERLAIVNFVWFRGPLLDNPPWIAIRDPWVKPLGGNVPYWSINACLRYLPGFILADPWPGDQRMPPVM